MCVNFPGLPVILRGADLDSGVSHDYSSGGLSTAIDVGADVLTTTTLVPTQGRQGEIPSLVPDTIRIRSLKIIAVGTPSHGGVVTITAEGEKLSYTPAAGYNGIETFTYTVKADNGLTAEATVTVTVGDPVVAPPDNNGIRPRPPRAPGDGALTISARRPVKLSANRAP